MDAVLSVQGASAPVKKKSFFSKFTRLNMLRLARAVIPAAVLMMFFPQLAMAAGSSGQDLIASGNTTVVIRPGPVLITRVNTFRYWFTARK